MQPITTTRTARTTLVCAALALFASVGLAQNKPILDVEQLIATDHAAHVKLLGKPTVVAKDTKQQVEYAWWADQKGTLFTSVNYRDKKPLLITMYVDSDKLPVEQLVKRFNIKVRPDTTKTTHPGDGLIWVSRGPVDKAPWSYVYLRRGQPQLWYEAAADLYKKKGWNTRTKFMYYIQLRPKVERRRANTPTSEGR